MGKTVEQKPAAKVKDPQYLSDLHDLPCCICEYYCMRQRSPTEAHHWIMGRGGSLKTPDGEAIPLCGGHHQGLRDTSKVAIHKSPDAWRRQFGDDGDWVSITQEKVRILRNNR